MDSAELLDLDVAAIRAAGHQDVLGRLEAQARMIAAQMAAVVADCEQTGAFKADGFRSINRWVAAVTNCSEPETRRKVRHAKLVSNLPHAAKVWAAAEIGTCQIDEIARLLVHLRAGAHVADSEHLLTDQAAVLRHADFLTVTQRWQSYADPDGHLLDHEHSHATRRVDIREDPTGIRFLISGDTISATGMRHVVDVFTRAEREADWDRVVAEHGDRARPGLLPRTLRQCRYDALQRIIQLAAGVGTNGTPITEPLVNLVIDEQTFNDAVRRMAGVEPATADPSSSTTRRCQTIDGLPIDPRQAVVAAIEGRVRAVIIDSTGRVLHLGRTQRLFNKATREAVMLAQPRCGWLTCLVRAMFAELDHRHDWDHGGLSDVENADPHCGHHHRFKHRHNYTITRDHHGTLHIWRSDGTEVAPLQLPR